MNKVEFHRTAKVPFAKRYDNFIGGKWTPAKSGRYFDNTSPVNGRVLCEIARSEAVDVEAALDAAHHRAIEARTSGVRRALSAKKKGAAKPRPSHWWCFASSSAIRFNKPDRTLFLFSGRTIRSACAGRTAERCRSW